MTQLPARHQTHAGPGLRLVPNEVDEYGGYAPSPAFHERPLEAPDELAARQAVEARSYLEQVRSGRNLRFPWIEMDRVIGPLLPGWLVFVGGRAKAGKTTLLRELLTAWVELDRTVVFVGTETEAPVLRLAWAAVRLGYDVETVLAPDCPQDIFDRCMHDVERVQTQGDLAYRAIFADSGKATLADLTYWIEYARKANADGLIFDHLGQLSLQGGERWSQIGDAIHDLKRQAVAARLTLVAGAQLTQGEGGSFLGEHEVPGNKSWAGSAEVQRTADVAIQAWRPFKTSVNAKQKREARDDASKVDDLLQHNTMAIRVSAHRYRNSAMNKCLRLRVENDQVTTYVPRY